MDVLHEVGDVMDLCRVLIVLLLSGRNLIGAERASECHVSYYHWPECIDYPDGYGCRCGPGFLWNGQMCVAIGLDSRLEFSSLTPPRYATILGKSFPALSSFTITAWVRLANQNRPGTLLSYSDSNARAVFSVALGRDVRVTLWDVTQTLPVTLSAPEWHHLAWTVNQRSGQWQLLVNGGKYKVSGKLSMTSSQSIPAGGELVLGQAARLSRAHFDQRQAFLGHVAFVNIWDRAMGRGEIRKRFRSCPLLSCGAAVQWADFRSGTRGSLKMTWPSAIFAKPQCFNDVNASLTCERYCSEKVGLRCRAEIWANVEWPRSAAGTSVATACPGHQSNSSRQAVRSCFADDTFSASWSEPNVTECVSSEILAIQTEMSAAEISDIDMTSLLASLSHFCQSATIKSPTDLSYILDILNFLIEKQRAAMNSKTKDISFKTLNFSKKRDSGSKNHTWNGTQVFLKLIGGLLDDLVMERHTDGWLHSKPRGSVGDYYLQTVDTFIKVAADSLVRHVMSDDVTLNKAVMSLKTSRLDLVIRVYRKDIIGTRIQFKFQSDTKINVNLKQNSSHTTLKVPEYVTVSSFVSKSSFIVPNHDVFRQSKEDNVNSALVGLHIFPEDLSAWNNTDLIRLHLRYYNNFNISNPKCVSLIHARNRTSWNWNGKKCKLTANTSHVVSCVCSQQGWFAVTSDMYDDNWRAPAEHNPLMEVPSYIGCAMSASMCLISVLLLTYLRTSSNTANIHKHFGIAIVMAQLVFMVGINRTEIEVVCHAFAVLFHYFFMTNFLWLMNESFNLYIVIIYAAHSHGIQTDSAAQWRFYILGWGLPAVIVGAMLGVHRENYYAENMCWISSDLIWFFIGPALGITAVAVLVLIFTAKEHKESSYSKNAETNSMIILYSKALWTQVILLSVCWSFAILSIKMRGTIIKWIYALFNIIQGAFFIVFFFLLNDEVRTVYRERRKLMQLSTSHYSLDHEAEQLQLIETNQEPVLAASSSSYNGADTSHGGDTIYGGDTTYGGDTSSEDSSNEHEHFMRTTSV